MRQNLTHLSSFLCLAALFFLGCGEEAEEPGRGGGPPEVRVSVGKVTDGSVQARWIFFGEARALSAATLSAGGDGEVRQVHVRVGDRVEAGDRLLDVDPRLLRAQLRAAQRTTESVTRELEQAQRDAERFSMAGGRAVAEAEIERTRSRAEVLGAEVARSEASTGEIRTVLGRHRIDAPFAGVVSERFLDPGDWVSPGTAAFTLVADGGVEIFVSANAEANQRLAAGDPATLRRGNVTVPATVVGLVNSLDPRTRTTRIRLTPDEAAPWLVPGATMDVIFEVPQSEDGALVVPRDAVVHGAAGRTRIVRSIDGVSNLMNVTIVAEGEGDVLIRAEPAEGAAPLAAGDDVVIRGNERLREGQTLTILALDGSTDAE